MMAKSFKKSDVVKSSDSCDDDHCQPCSFHGKTVLSERYCIDCEEYLCTKCSAHHRTQRALRNHTLVSKKEAKKSPHVVVKDKCSEKCTVHKDKTVKYFCKTHNVLGCSVCITMTHKQCDNVDYIPEVSADIKHNDDFKKFDEKLKAIEAACKAGISDVKKNLKVAENDHDQLKDAMQHFRKQVIGALDKLENELMAKAGSIMREETKKLDDLSKKLSNHQADANAMIKQADTLLSSGKHCDTYVYMKHATKQLVSLDEELKRMTTGNTLQRYEFQPNMDTLKTIASGKLSCRADPSKRGAAQRVRKQRLSKYKMPKKTSDHSETDDFVVFKVISKVPDKVIQDSIEDMVEQEFVTEELPLNFEKDEDQLSYDENKLLETVAEKHCIKIAIEVRDKKPSLKMFGLKSKVRKAQETFNHIVYIQFPETRRKKKMANYVLETFQWYYDDHGNVKPVDAACNLDLYMGYIKGEDFTYKKGDTVYKVLVRDLKEHPVRDPNKKRQLYLKNKLSKDVGLPDGWKIKISGAEYEEVELSMNDIEFNDVKAKFINGGCKASKFERIVRIENKFLWQHYQTKKEHMERQNPKGVQNERELWHGTDIDTAQIIVKKGYDRGFVGKNAAYFGRGVYFAVTSEYSGRNTYAKEDNKGVRRMFLNKVLTGEYTKVAEDAGVLPVKDKTDRHCILYDSAVNDMNNIAMFVIFHDTQAYPQYLVEYKA